MVFNKMRLPLAAACISFGATAVHAESLATIGAIPAKQLSMAQMKAVEGKAHVYLLIESRGVELPAQGEAATRAAAPTPQNGGAGGSDTFVRSPSRDAAAFVTALGAPATPTRQ